MAHALLESLPDELRQMLRVPGAREAAPPTWAFESLIGALIELSCAGDSASLTLATSLVHGAQRQGELAAWLTRESSHFFPPDVAASGVDLRSLVVVRQSEIRALTRAAEHLLRSGAFGLVVIDLAAEATGTRVSEATLMRLAGATKRHGSVVLCLTRKPPHQPSLGSLVTLRGHAVRRREGDHPIACEIHILRDRRHGSGWSHSEVRHGPDGMC
jgi:recombination protein RecA